MMEMVMVTYSWGSTPARQRGKRGGRGVMATPTGPQTAAAQGEVPAGTLVNFAEGAAPVGTRVGVKEAKGRFTFPPGPKQEGPQGGRGLAQVEPGVVQERVGVGLRRGHAVRRDKGVTQRWEAGVG